MISIKYNKLFLDRYLFDSDLEEYTYSEKRMVRRVSSKLDMAEDVSKYAFYAQGLHNLYTQNVVKAMVKHQDNGLYHGRMRLFL